MEGGRVIPLSLAAVAEITGARPHLVADPAAVADTVVIDSRAAGPGALFAALPGARVDGLGFAPQAVAAGAVAVLATRPASVPTLVVPDVPAAMAALASAVVARLPGLTIAGITGSAGKTTAKDLAAQLVEPLGPTVSPYGSYNNEIGHPLTILRVTEATRYLLLELSARGAGHIARQCEVARPSLGVVLCVGRAHAGEFGGLAEVARAKGELPAALPAGGVALLNADDPLVAAMAGRTAARVVTFGRGPGAAVRAAGVRLDSQGRPVFTLVTPAGSAPVRMRLFGEHNVTNALAAAALATELGLPLPQVADGLSTATARSRWRMEVTRRPDGVTVINDAYNASPEAVAAAIESLAFMARDGRAFAVLGPMYELGSQSDAIHEEVGRLAARAGVAGLIVVGEEAAPVLAGAKAEDSWHGELLAVPDAAGAVEALGARLAPGDVVLVKAAHSFGLESAALALTGEAAL
ncbi:MAG TPA: UDP-N-acetylmuramoyl-tripeptide--D-alanyl-D-alanine ligase [Streptosporangiaceae bacterium]|nr:UDP-N-acetylmuramoyl-tripeptide--D-alanyl-D-alanine ligase [Streptosporangiaceae bacterium]